MWKYLYSLYPLILDFSILFIVPHEFMKGINVIVVII
jgi:hypothetical protein